MIVEEFLFDNNLNSALENLIHKAKKELILVSPYIDLDPRIESALRQKLESKDLSITVLFGKNDGDYYKSIKKESLDFLMQFPQIEIRHEPRLHAKFYLNDIHCLFTSLNLFKFSLANNIEVGVLFQHSAKGLIHKAVSEVGSVVNDAMDKVKESVIGVDNKINPLEKFDQIIRDSKLIYKTTPVLVDKGGILGAFGGKKMDGFIVDINEIENNNSEKRNIKETEYTSSYTEANKSLKSGKLISATALAKELNMSAKEVKFRMENKGLINGDQITDMGRSKGITLKNGTYGEYIAYPIELVSEL